MKSITAGMGGAGDPTVKDFQAKQYAEAIRYMDNAKEVLKKSGKEHTHYLDQKYVRMACGTAYSGVLIALDAWLALKGVEVPTPEKGKNAARKKQIGYYKDQVARIDGKMLTYLNTAYQILHLYGYYDGTTSVKTIEAGFEDAYWIINKIKPA